MSRLEPEFELELELELEFEFEFEFKLDVDFKSSARVEPELAPVMDLEVGPDVLHDLRGDGTGNIGDALLKLDFDLDLPCFKYFTSDFLGCVLAIVVRDVEELFTEEAIEKSSESNDVTSD